MVIPYGDPQGFRSILGPVIPYDRTVLHLILWFHSMHFCYLKLLKLISTIVDAMITVLIPKSSTAVINFITVILLIPLNYKTVTVTVTVILIYSGNFQDCNVSVPGKTTDSGATEYSNIITVIGTLQSCN